MNETLNSIANNLDHLIYQLSSFINQFNNIVNTQNVNVITDASGNMSRYVPKNMPNDMADKLGNKVGIIDRLIGDRSSEIEKLLKEGS